jgi:ABC-type branched-subunit amino acid transport system substrate-binding protein
VAQGEGKAGSTAAGAAGKPRTAAGGVPMGVGVTPTEITIGVEAANDINKSTAAVGAKTNNPEEKEVAAAVVGWINEHGGIAGRKVVVVRQQTDETSGTWAAHAQTACSTFAEDNHVFAAISSSVGGDDSLAACMTSHKTPLIEQDFWPFDAGEYARFGNYLYQPGRAVPERWTTGYVDALASNHFFDGGKVGIIRFDKPVFAQMATTMRSRLARYGVSVVDEQGVFTPGGVADFGAMGAQIGNAILSFRSKGVDRVLFAEWAGILPFVMLAAADGQGYHPRYAFSSIDRANTQASQSKQSQLHGALNVGWTPDEDVDISQDRRGGNAALCLRIGKEKGVSGDQAGGGFRLYMQIFCDSIFFLKAAAEHATALTPDGLRASVESLGTSYDSSYTFATRFGPGRHDGAAEMRVSRYDDGCGCFLYADTTTLPMP